MKNSQFFFSRPNSNGYDGISTKLIKKYSAELAEAFANFINKSFEQGDYPDELKIGCVVPIHKKSDRQVMSNYRPITKLSIGDEIFEEALLIRLKTFLNCNKMIHENQFGFVEQSNTLAANLNFVENLYDHLENRKYIAILSIDLQKAFDSVNIDCLI